MYHVFLLVFLKNTQLFLVHSNARLSSFNLFLSVGPRKLENISGGWRVSEPSTSAAPDAPERPETPVTPSSELVLRLMRVSTADEDKEHSPEGECSLLYHLWVHQKCFSLPVWLLTAVHAVSYDFEQPIPSACTMLLVILLFCFRTRWHRWRPWLRSPCWPSSACWGWSRGSKRTVGASSRNGGR